MSGGGFSDMAEGTHPEIDATRRDLLRRLGCDELQHDSHVPFDSHLEGTFRQLVDWGERQALCDAGLFHSAYGTEYFGLERPAERSEVRYVIGDEAEEIVWLWCTIERDTLDPANCTVADRRTGGLLELSRRCMADLATLWAADTVEQIDRMAPSERSFAAGLPAVISMASPPARAAVESLGI